MSADRVTPREVSELFRKLLAHALPGLELAAPIRATVVKVREEGGQADSDHKRYSVDVQPLRKDGTADDNAPVLEDVELSPIWAGDQTGIYALPPVGATVRVAFYSWDASQPYVDAVLADGWQVPEHPQGQLLIQRGSVKVVVEDGRVTVEAPEILLGEDADSPVVRCNELTTYLAGHYHTVVAMPNPGGAPLPTLPPVEPPPAGMASGKARVK